MVIYHHTFSDIVNSLYFHFITPFLDFSANTSNSEWVKERAGKKKKKGKYRPLYFILNLRVNQHMLLNFYNETYNLKREYHTIIRMICQKDILSNKRI